ncbi:hypothetical protein MNBD_NITROSPINAE01-1888 [hydrothermal vent metagenome]|uniref:Cytochrome c domain-containing protein n=1 Tax=hydrothermal vent metagenome TaxID=652676 RepID=A0A3B1CHQ7_9ZZZZ
MKNPGSSSILALFAALLITFQPTSAYSAETTGATKALYVKHCGDCHNEKRLGTTAPPLIPGYYSRSNRKRIFEVIRDGLPASQMPAFKGILSDEEMRAITKYIKTPVKKVTWTFNDIRKSRKEFVSTPPSVNMKERDLEDLTLVMERGTKSVVVLDNGNFNILTKFKVGAVHGGPKYSYALDKIYAVARDGLVTVFDIKTLSTILQTRVSISARGIAVSHDDKTIGVANYLPSNVVFFDAQMEPLYEIPLDDKAGGFYSIKKEKLFVLSFRDKPEIWFIDPANGFKIDKHILPEPFEDFSISPFEPRIVGAKRGSGKMYVYDYKQRKIVGTFPAEGLPHVASATFWKTKNGTLYSGINHIMKPEMTILNMSELKIAATVPLPGAGFFVRTHANLPDLWVDTETEKIVLVDKKTFKIVKTLIPRPGRKAMHVEFDKAGNYALITIPGDNGAVIIYDTDTIKPVKTMPFSYPVGKYNATNKTYPARTLDETNPPERTEKNLKAFSSTPIDDSIMDTSSNLGEEVYYDYCMGCHHQTLEAFGPSLRDIARKRTRSQIQAHILAPKSSAPALGYKNNSMPKIVLSDKKLEAITDYIISYK